MSPETLTGGEQDPPPQVMVLDRGMGGGVGGTRTDSPRFPLPLLAKSEARTHI